MDMELRAELLALRGFLLLTLAEVANSKPDPAAFLDDSKKELLRSLGNVRIEPVHLEQPLRDTTVAFVEDWFTHMHFKAD